MRKAISLILVIITIISTISIPVQSSSGEDYITIRSAGIDREYTEDVMGFKFYITNPNNSSKKLRINEEILSTDGYLVYGSYKDVPQDPINDYKEVVWKVLCSIHPLKDLDGIKLNGNWIFYLVSSFSLNLCTK